MANKTTNKKPTKPIETQVVREDTVLEVVEETPAVAVKRIIKSKTIWVNAIAFLAFWIQRQYGFVISEDLQMQALTLINIALRFITKDKIVWGGEDGNSQETA
jgi:type IV secretory pathway ATPase VirB11/archaellum biosynthesis ATPase